MTEEQESDKYIKCSMCKCKSINDDEHSKADFGDNRLNERFKTWFKCRAWKKQSNEHCKEQISERGKEYYEQHKDKMNDKNKTYHENNKDKKLFSQLRL